MTALWIGVGVVAWIAVGWPVAVLVGGVIRNAESERAHPGDRTTARCVRCHQVVDDRDRHLADVAGCPGP